MEKIKSLCVICLCSICISSCSIDERVSLPDGQYPEKEMVISFFSDPMAEFRVGTKASDPKEQAEKEIRQLYIFFFGNDGEYLKGGYLTGYNDAPLEGGFYSPGEGVTLLKIDNEKFTEPDKARNATVYALANLDLDPMYLVDEDNDGRPDYFRNLASLEEFIYTPHSGISLGLPEKGMPMVGKKVMNFTGADITPEDERKIELTALMARVDFNIRLGSDVSDHNLPSLTLVNWTAMNLPASVPLTYNPSENTGDGWPEWGAGENPKDIESSLQRTIYNQSGNITFSFYMFENLQDSIPASSVNWDGAVTDPQTGYPYDVYNPEKGIDIRQRYKPWRGADTANSAAVEIHGFYSTYNDDGAGSATYEVRYRLYLGSNHIENFEVKRNRQYKNDITIKGLTRVGNNPEHITFDARVDITEDGNEFYIAMLRERNHDAHFCVTPMDVYLFRQENNPTMEVILGSVPAGSQTPDPSTVPDWIRMEKIPAANMASGTVPANLAATNASANLPWHAGNGKRNYFTTTLLRELPSAVTVDNNRDRVYFYLGENLSTVNDREATVTLIYKENGVEVRRRTIKIVQVHLLPVHVVDENNDYYIYMEQFEEYLDHYDPLDEHRTEQLYNGLPWAQANTTLSTEEILRVTDADKNAYDTPELNIHSGFPYTGFVIQYADQGIMTLNSVPLSAFQYCHNKNLRRAGDNVVPAQYTRFYNYVPAGFRYKMDYNYGKWFLPGIRQMERALTQYYSRYEEFQNYFYWSSSAGESFNWFGNPNGQRGDKARATKAKADGTYWDSGNGDDYPNGGYANRTEVLRIRAFRVDTLAVQY